jgi:hypothetical protein
MLGDYIQLRHPIIHIIEKKIFKSWCGGTNVTSGDWRWKKEQLDSRRYHNGTGTDPFFIHKKRKFE